MAQGCIVPETSESDRVPPRVYQWVESGSLAAGGTVIPYRPGGTLVQVAEAGRDELVSGNTVVPLSKGWENNGLGGGPTFGPGAIVIHITNPDPGAVVDLLQKWAEINGPLPVVVQGAA